MIVVVFFQMGWMGCTQRSKAPKKADAALQTPFDRLMAGNERFASLNPIHPDQELSHLKDVAKEQHPFAVVVSCSDSRVSPELVFDQGPGDLFVIRTAGNIIGDIELGSIEYAVEHLGVKLIVVMGHKNCGAVQAFVEGSEAPGHIKTIIDSLKQEAEVKAIPVNDVNRLEECVKANIRHGLLQLKQNSAPIAEKLKENELVLTGLLYDLDNFKVSIVSPKQ